MKKKKLNLKKEVISKLQSNELQHLKGGTAESLPPGCPGDNTLSCNCGGTGGGGTDHFSGHCGSEANAMSLILVTLISYK